MMKVKRKLTSLIVVVVMLAASVWPASLAYGYEGNFYELYRHEERLYELYGYGEYICELSVNYTTSVIESADRSDRGITYEEFDTVEVELFERFALEDDPCIIILEFPDEFVEVTFIPASEMDAETLRAIEHKIEMYIEYGQIVVDEFVERSLANLRVSNLTTISHQPLAFGGMHDFRFTITNSGAAAVNNVMADIHVANHNLGRMNIGTIPGGITGTVTFSLRFTQAGGAHFMDIVVGGSRTSTRFTWANFFDLAVSDLRIPTGQIVATYQKTFSVLVENLGNITAQSPFVEFSIIGDVYVMEGFRRERINLPTLPPGYGIRVTWVNFIDSSGSATIRAEVGQLSTRDDRPANNVVNRNIQVIPDGCGLWAFRLAPIQARNIRISVDDDLISVLAARTAAFQWNNIVSNSLHVSSVEQNVPWTQFMNARIRTDPTLPSDIGGRFVRHDTVGNLFTSGDILICSRNWAQQGPNSFWGRYVLIHEIGHLIGLGHPREPGQLGGNEFCRDRAVMQDDPSAVFWSDRVTNHDRQAIRLRFGYSRISF